MNWKIIAGVICIPVVAALVGKILMAMPTLCYAYRDIGQVYPYAILAFHAVSVVAVASALTAGYLYFMSKSRKGSEVKKLEDNQLFVLHEQMERKFKEEKRAEIDKIRAMRQEAAEEKADAARQRKELDLIKIQVYNLKAEIEAKSLEIITKTAEVESAGRVAQSVIESTDKIESIYHQLIQILEAVAKDPAALMERFEPDRVKRQMKQVQKMVEDCSEYWDQVNTLRFGAVVEDLQDSDSEAAV